MAILTELKKEGFISILQQYDIGRYISHKHVPWALQNTVYFIRTTKGRFVLKIFEDSDPDFINFQIRIMKLMEREGIPVPGIIKSESGFPLLIYNKHRIMIQEHVEGKSPKRLSNPLIRDIAKNHAMMNKALGKVRLEGKYVWRRDYQFMGPGPDVSKYKDFDMALENKKIKRDLRCVNRHNLRRSVIHGDFHGTNLLVKGDRLKAIIDWGDLNEDFIVQDVSNFIAHTFLEQRAVKSDQIRLYLRTFGKHLELNNDEKKAIYFFIKHRWIFAIVWHIKQLRIHKDHSERLEKSINESIRKYRNFSKMNVNDFLKLFQTT